MISVLMSTVCIDEKKAALELAIHSILNQTYKDIELLICDDGSSEGTKLLLDDIAAQNARVKLIRTGIRCSLPQTLNLLLREANGEYIARMDDDDISYPERLSSELAFLQENEKISFVGCNVNEILPEGKKHLRHLPSYPQLKDFLFTMPYIHPTLLFRREVLEAVAGYEDVIGEDYDLLLRLYEKGFYGANLSCILFDYSIISAVTKRKPFRYRFGEVKMRFRRFNSLGILPIALPWVLKPLIIGLLPLFLLNKLKNIHRRKLKVI